MKRLAASVSAVLFVISTSAMALNTDPVDQKKNREKPVSPIRLSATEDGTVEFDPTAPDAMETLRAFDQAVRMETGDDTMSESLYYPQALESLTGGCVRAACKIWVNVAKNERPEKAYIYIDGRLANSWLVSTAGPGHVTPNWEGHPSGPFYPGAYTSRKFPGGDYKGLGNMPYAMFYNGGFAFHGTPSISKLGTPASHGCTRMHPDNAHYLNQLVRAAGAENVYFSVTGDRLPVGSPAVTVSQQ